MVCMRGEENRQFMSFKRVDDHNRFLNNAPEINESVPSMALWKFT